MVRGIDIFQDFFKDHADKYILIGGTACDIAMSQMDMNFRPTKDLDIVLIVEALNADFGGLIWEFIKKGQYQNKQKSTGKTEFYRFYEPAEPAFPYTLEFFARKPDVLKLNQGSHLTPIPIEEEISSLSAILLDDEYYQFILKGKTILDGVPLITQEYLIPLKARAYMDLSQLKKSGERVDRKKVNKHKLDVLRLYQILSSETRIGLPVSIADDMSLFLSALTEEPPDLKSLGLRNTSLEEIISNIKAIYGL